MNLENEISAELKEMDSKLADMPRSMPFSVPDGYFAAFPENLTETQKLLNTPDPVFNGSKNIPFSVPSGYFENLTSDIINNTEANRHSKDDIKSMPLSVPVGYFEQLPAQILNTVKAVENKTSAKVIVLNTKSIFRKVQWAAAAMFVLFIGLGAYITFISGRSTNPEMMLASVSTNEIDDYVAHTYRIDIDKVTGNTDINNIPLENKEIVQYLNETGWDIVE